MSDDDPTALASTAVERLARSGCHLDTALSEAELAAVEQRYGIRFGDDHRALLRLAVPTRDGWVDWRHGDEHEIRRKLEWPIEGVVFDVHRNGFWPASWGPKPTGDAVEATAREQLSRWPKLTPLCGHRYLPADPAPLGSPVFSVHQTDVVVYGADIVDFISGSGRPRPTPRYRYPPWSDFEWGPTNDEL